MHEISFLPSMSRSIPSRLKTHRIASICNTLELFRTSIITSIIASEVMRCFFFYGVRAATVMASRARTFVCPGWPLNVVPPTLYMSSLIRRPKRQHHTECYPPRRPFSQNTSALAPSAMGMMRSRPRLVSSRPERGATLSGPFVIYYHGYILGSSPISNPENKARAVNRPGSCFVFGSSVPQQISSDLVHTSP